MKPIYENHCQHDKKLFAGSFSHNFEGEVTEYDVHFKRGQWDLKEYDKGFTYCLRFSNEDCDYISGDLRHLVFPPDYKEFSKSFILKQIGKKNKILTLFFQWCIREKIKINPEDFICGG